MWTLRIWDLRIQSFLLCGLKTSANLQIRICNLRINLVICEQADLWNLRICNCVMQVCGLKKACLPPGWWVKCWSVVIMYIQYEVQHWFCGNQSDQRVVVPADCWTEANGDSRSISIIVPVVNIAQDVMILMWATSFTRAIGRGVCSLPFQAQKSLDFQAHLFQWPE